MDIFFEYMLYKFENNKSKDSYWRVILNLSISSYCNFQIHQWWVIVIGVLNWTYKFDNIKISNKQQLWVIFIGVLHWTYQFDHIIISNKNQWWVNRSIYDLFDVMLGLEIYKKNNWVNGFKHDFCLTRALYDFQLINQHSLLEKITENSPVHRAKFLVTSRVYRLECGNTYSIL